MTKKPLVITALALLLLQSTDVLAQLTFPRKPDSIPTRTLSPESSPIPRYASRITTAPKVDDVQKLFARATISLTTDNRFCAFANGDGASPIFCPNGYTCTLLGNEYLASAFGCCNQQNCVNAPHTCFAENDPLNFCAQISGAVDCTQLYTSILTCTGNKPKCVTYILKTNTLDPQATDGVQSWSCGATSSQVFVYLTPTINANAKVEPTEDASPTGATSSPKSSNNNNSDNNNDNNSRKGLDTGTIIGIVVAAVGVIASLMVGLFPRQMIRCLTCGLRPKKEHSNDEIRKITWGYLSGNGGQVHVHLHTGSEQSLPLAQGAAPITTTGGMYWDGHQWQIPQQPQQQWAPGYQEYTGYGQQPPPSYQPQGQQYAAPTPYSSSHGRTQEHQPFLELDDTRKQ
ncbi:hypothetical protein ABW20_dc0104508 [Dactylellina cionopaga]|nr:hypothetical protein ABW20_dc0104508 [Dactylellina cionopaga]